MDEMRRPLKQNRRKAARVTRVGPDGCGIAFQISCKFAYTVILPC